MTTDTKKTEHQTSPTKKYLILFFMGVMVYGFFTSIYKFRIGAAKENIPVREISDLWYILIASVINLAFRPVFNYFFSEPIVARIKSQNLPDEALRIKKSMKQGKDAIIYSVTFIWGMIVVNGTDSASKYIGGNGQCCDIHNTWPFMNHYSGIRWYLIFQFGHHLQSLVYHSIVMLGEKNYWELLVHHFATVFSILFCYFTNFENYGPFILIASDLSDAFLNIGKVYRDVYGFSGTKADVMFGIVMGTWFLTRNVFLMGCWVTSTVKWLPFKEVILQNNKYDYLWDATQFSCRFVIFSVYTICFLNWYWFMAAMKILYNKLYVHGEYVVHFEGDVAKAEAEKLKEKVENLSKDTSGKVKAN